MPTFTNKIFTNYFTISRCRSSWRKVMQKNDLKKKESTNESNSKLELPSQVNRLLSAISCFLLRNSERYFNDF